MVKATYKLDIFPLKMLETRMAKASVGLTLKERILRLTKVNEYTSCWEWQGRRTRDGYGSIKYDGSMRGAHRVAWITWRGDPGDMQVDHTCRNRSCCNPNHLRLMTKAQNLATRVWPPKTHCSQGHEYTEENTSVRKYKNGRPDGKRCRTCQNEQARNRKALMAPKDLEKKRKYDREYQIRRKKNNTR